LYVAVLAGLYASRIVQAADLNMLQANKLIVSSVSSLTSV
jgi:hypothetical protein